ncbi:MAG: thioredoxin family protein [Elusimicrobia bacterium]|nr:thioredoxin family protein [Elusimicrobiota bacterium]
MEELKSKEEFDRVISENKSLVLFAFYTETSRKSVEALNVLGEFDKANENILVYSINATEVRDIHPVFGINSVPAVLVFSGGKKVNVIYGLQNRDYYENLLSEASHSTSDSSRKVNRVVVYTSDGCPWCARAKEYLRKIRVPFREINVSRKPSEAERLVKKTGQMGTPQIDINGNFVVGFDKPKIDRFLGIREN